MEDILPRAGMYEKEEGWAEKEKVGRKDKEALEGGN